MELVIDFLIHAVGWIIGETFLGFFDTFELGWHVVLAGLELAVGLVFGAYVAHSLGPTEASSVVIGVGLGAVPLATALAAGTVVGFVHTPWRFSGLTAAHLFVLVLAIGIGRVMS